MRNRTLIFSTALVAACLVATGVEAQWVSFSDDTGTRLNLEPFADDPTGNPLQDDQEKDVAVGDLDKDGDDDLIVVRKNPFSNPGERQDVLLMNENGVLVDRTATLAPGFLTDMTDARDVAIADFTGDGWLDVVVAPTFNDTPKFYRNLGESGGNWQGLVDESNRLPAMAPLLICALWAGDVNGDGALDIYLSNYDPGFSGTKDYLLINDGSGFFADETAARLGNFANVAFGTSAEIHDVDNDGDQDIVKISTLYSAPPFSLGQFILFNDGTGVFDNIPFQEMPSVSPYFFAAGHLNGDDMIDFLMVGDAQDFTAVTTAIVPDQSLTFDTFNLSPSPRTDGFGGNTKLADIDGDGDLDGGVSPIDVDIQNCPGGGEFALLRNDGTGRMSDPWAGNDPQNFHTDPHDFAFFDLNSDGCLDIFMGKCTGWEVFVQEDCEPAHELELTMIGGSCGGTVTIMGTGFGVNKEVGLVAAANTNGFTKSGGLCAGAEFEVGEPFDLPPTFAKTDSQGTFVREIETEPGFCLVEALDLFATCQTSNVLDTDVDAPTGNGPSSRP